LTHPKASSYKTPDKTRREAKEEEMRRGQILRWAMRLFVLVCFTGFAVAADAGPAAIDATHYPSLSDKEIGHLRWIVKLAEQPPGDWSHMGGAEPGQENMEAYRYQLGFMTYFLALAQYHKTPAYREVYQRAMDRLIQKMVRKDVWSYWPEVSKGGKAYDPDLKEFGPGWIDPVRDQNIMYSGHLLHMLGLYKMLYRDAKYHSVCCEINAVFPECNQHPILGLMLYDHVNRTDYSSVRESFKKVFYEKKFIDPTTHNAMAFYMVKQDKVVPISSPAADGWTGAFMHAWDPKFIESHYPYQAKRHVKWHPDGTASAPDRVHKLLGEAFFSILAKEIGDSKTAEGILAWADKNLNPSWQDGTLRFPRDDEKGVTALVDNLLALARVNVGNGLWTLHNRPWDEDHLAKPYISRVEYPQAVVQQAYYDSAKDVLVATLAPGTRDTKSTSFAVNNLDASKVYSIIQDGRTLGQLRKGTLDLKSETKGVEWKAEGALTLLTTLAKPTTFLIAAER
jgi:hypothetical protein